MNFKEKLELYAKLVVERGLNVQEGQDVYITSEVVHQDFVALVVKEAYLKGARIVSVDFVDPRNVKTRILHSKKEEYLDYVAPFVPYRYERMLDETAANMRILGSEYPEIGGLTSDESFGRLGAKTFFYYVLTVLVAILIGVALVSFISFESVKPPSSNGIDTAVPIQLPSSGTALVKEILFKIMPSNIISAATNGNMLGIIFFSLLYGFALSKVSGPAQETQLKFWQGLFGVMMRVTHIIMAFLPFGVFFLVARTVAVTGFQSIASVGLFVCIVLLGLALFLFVGLPILLFLRGASVIRYFKAVTPALVTAFSTSSSAATLPITMECVEKRAGVSNRICSFVVPLGTSVNMTGSALYECVGALFITSMLGIHLDILQQIMVIIMSLLAAMGMAGIPSASLISLIVILNTLGLPAESIALVLPVERILDMFRTVVNVASEAGCAVMVARWEGENVLPREKKKVSAPS